MKFMLNGAITLGTRDGATVEILEEAGEENSIVFGLTSEEIEAMDHYDPKYYYENTPGLKRVVDSLIDGSFQDRDGVLREIYNSLLFENGWDHPDLYFLLADYSSYRQAQERAAKLYKDPDLFASMAIRNMCAAGKFSSDRAVEDYVKGIWQINKISR